MSETIRRIGLHPPAFHHRVLEILRIRQIRPSDIAHDVDLLIKTFPELGGDRTCIGWGDDGHCQSYHGDYSWWRDLLTQFPSQD